MHSTAQGDPRPWQTLSVRVCVSAPGQRGRDRISTGQVQCHQAQPASLLLPQQLKAHGKVEHGLRRGHVRHACKDGRTGVADSQRELAGG